MTEIVTLKQLCKELKIEPRIARKKLRRANKDHPELAHTARQPWQWEKGSPGEKEARATLAPQT